MNGSRLCCRFTVRQCDTFSALSAKSGFCVGRCALGHVCTVAAVAAFDNTVCEDFYGDGALDAHAAVTAVLTAVIFRVCAVTAENLCVFAYDNLDTLRCILPGRNINTGRAVWIS